MGLRYPDSLIASHINMIRASAPTWSKHPILALQHALQPYSSRDRAGLERSAWFNQEGSGYRLLQSTKPQTLGYALSDPVALLAWILEKLHDWTDRYPWVRLRSYSGLWTSLLTTLQTDDEILTWVSIYLFATAGVRQTKSPFRVGR